MNIDLLSLRPEFFDIFGLAVFTFILGVGSFSLISKKRLPKWTAIALIIIGVLGLVVDGTIVFITYLSK